MDDDDEDDTNNAHIGDEITWADIEEISQELSQASGRVNP